MVPDSNSSDPGEQRRKTVLPPRRKGPPGQVPVVRPVDDPEGGEVYRDEGEDSGRPAGGVEDSPEAGVASAPPYPLRRPKAQRSKLVAVIFTVIVPAAVLGLVILLVNRLDTPRLEPQQLSRGELHRFTDGLIAIQEDPDSDKRVYYLVEVPPTADPLVRFGEKSMTLVVRTADGSRDLIRPVDWDEAPYAMLIDYLDLSGETPKVPCEPETIESYVETAGPTGSVGLLASRLRQAAAAP